MFPKIAVDGEGGLITIMSLGENGIQPNYHTRQVSPSILHFTLGIYQIDV